MILQIQIETLNTTASYFIIFILEYTNVGINDTEITYKNLTWYRSTVIDSTVPLFLAVITKEDRKSTRLNSSHAT